MGLSMSNAIRAGVVAGGLSLAAVVFTHSDASAAGAKWCANVGASVNCEWDTKKQCRQANSYRKRCFKNPG